MTETTEAPPQGAAKRDVLQELGEPTLVLPAMINGALAANDRAKYLLSLLQAARSNCKTEARARQVLAALGARMAEAGLRLHPAKTRIVYCKDPAAASHGKGRRPSTSSAMPSDPGTPWEGTAGSPGSPPPRHDTSGARH